MPNTKLTPPEATPPLHTLSNFLIGILPALLALLLFLFSPAVDHTIESLVVWGLCVGLFALADMLSEPIERGYWTGYVNLAGLVAWLSLGLLPGFSVILVGSLGGAAARIRFGGPLKLPPMRWRGLASHGGKRFLISGAALAAAAGIYRLLNGQLPLQDISRANVLPLLVALGVSLFVSQIVGVGLARAAGNSLAETLWSPGKRDRLFSELSLILLALVLPVVLFKAGIIVFGVILLLIAAQAVRYRQVGIAGQESVQLFHQSATLIEKLSLVNRSIQNAMFNVDQQEAMRTACETAIAIAQGSRAAIFLINREEEELSLIAQVNLNTYQQQVGRDIAYQPELYPVYPRMVSDTELESTNRDLREFARLGQFRAFVEMPLRAGNVMSGYLAVYHDQPHTHTKTELDLLEILANQLTAALDNTQLLRALEVHAFEMTHLVHLSRISAASLDLKQVAADVSAVLRQMTATDWVMITLDHDESYTEVVGIYNGNGEINSAAAQPAPDARLLITPDSPHLTHFNQETAPDTLRDFMASSGLASLGVLPMFAHDKPFGAIFIGTFRQRDFTDREGQLLETAANQIAMQLYNLREYQRTHEALNSQLQQLALIEDIVQQISGSHDFNQIISDMFEAAFKTTQADVVGLALLTEVDDMWVIEQSYINGQPQRNYSTQRKDQGIIGSVVASGELVLVRDNLEVNYYLPASTGSYRSSLAVPLLRDGLVTGVLNVESGKVGAFTRAQANFLKNLAGHAVISIENARLLEVLQYQLDTLKSLRELSLSVSSATDTASVSRAILATALTVTEGEYAALFDFDLAHRQVIPLIGTERDRTLVTPAESEALEQLAQVAAMTGEIQSLESVIGILPDDAPLIPYYQSFVAVPIMRGAHIHQVLCVAYTERQYFESRDLNTFNLLAIQAAGHLENAMLHERIHDGNNRMRAILDSTRDGVILLDSGGRLIEVNPSAERLMGLNLSESIGESFVETLLKQVNAEGQQQAGYSRDELTRLARIERLQPEGITRREFSRMVHSNQVIYVEEVGSPVNDENDHPVGRLLVLRDITEEKLVEAYRDEISSMIVHDLRAPLASMMTALSIAQENIEVPEQQAVVRQIMKATNARASDLMDLVSSLLDIRKGREMSLDRSPTSLEELAELTRLTLLSSIENAKVKLVIDIPASTPLVHVDSDKIRRVLQNLLDNAIRYTPTGSEVRISARHDASSGKVLVRVADSGRGIPQKERERIFRLYWQMKDNPAQRGSKGSGIGLAFCQRVLEAHNERIWVEDEGPLPGASFAFTLPVVS